jgi:hypothetical protein
MAKKYPSLDGIAAGSIWINCPFAIKGFASSELTKAIPTPCTDAKSVCDALRPCAVVGFGHEFPVIGRQHDVS